MDPQNAVPFGLKTRPYGRSPRPVGTNYGGTRSPMSAYRELGNVSGVKDGMIYALQNYRDERENGDDVDSPNYPFPADGHYIWETPSKDWSYVRYLEGPSDRQWMEEKDRNYLLRLEQIRSERRQYHQNLSAMQTPPATQTPEVMRRSNGQFGAIVLGFFGFVALSSAAYILLNQNTSSRNHSYENGSNTAFLLTIGAGVGGAVAGGILGYDIGYSWPLARSNRTLQTDATDAPVDTVHQPIMKC